MKPAWRHHNPPLAIDIFCQIIDNFGDIGVCWRLARQLAGPPHQCRVRLWVDDLDCFKMLEPGIHPEQEQQRHLGIDIVHWHDATPTLQPLDVVIEAFACTLPHGYIDAMHNSGSLWINLEYLSAEPWVDSFHLQPSPQSGGLRKYFFFPGFTPQTGGLLREHNLVERRDTWLSDSMHRNRLLQRCGIPADDINTLQCGAHLVFLFCYPDAPVSALVNALQHQVHHSLLLIPEGVLPHFTPASGTTGATANQKLRTHRIPFVSQTDFDHLLWSADLNIVRGEDSWIRALWAGRPTIWQPYAQSDNAHLAKLDAWLERSPFHPDTQTLIRSWNTRDVSIFRQQLNHHYQPDIWSRWQAQSLLWSRQLASQTDLATALLEFCTQQLRTG